MTDTKELIARLRMLAESATPGQWRFVNHNNEPELSQPSDDFCIVSELGKVIVSEPACSRERLPEVCNGEYVAAVNPANIISLLDALEAAAAENARLAAELETIRKQEPVAYMVGEPVGCNAPLDGGAMLFRIEDYNEATTYCDDDEEPIKLYAAPVAQPAQARELSDVDLERIAIEEEFILYCDMDEFKEIARAIVAACKRGK